MVPVYSLGPDYRLASVMPVHSLGPDNKLARWCRYTALGLIADWLGKRPGLREKAGLLTQSVQYTAP